MKKALPYLAILAVFFCLLCCSQEKESVISGVVQNLEATHITINEQTVTLNESGQFRHAVEIEEIFGHRINLIGPELHDL